MARAQQEGTKCGQYNEKIIGPLKKHAGVPLVIVVGGVKRYTGLSPSNCWVWWRPVI